MKFMPPIVFEMLGFNESCILIGWEHLEALSYIIEGLKVLAVKIQITFQFVGSDFLPIYFSWWEYKIIEWFRILVEIKYHYCHSFNADFFAQIQPKLLTCPQGGFLRLATVKRLSNYYAQHAWKFQKNPWSGSWDVGLHTSVSNRGTPKRGFFR